MIDSIIERKNSKFLDMQEVISIFEIEQHLDKVCTRISLDKIKAQHNSKEIYEENLLARDPTAQYPSCFAAFFEADINDFCFIINKEYATEEVIFKADTLILNQKNQMSDS